MNCYLSRNYRGISSAGNKAKTDIERLMFEAGFKNVGLKQTVYTNPVLAFLSTLAGVLKAPFGLHASDCLVLQYPLKKYFSFVCNLAHLRGAKVIVVIHDLGSFRRKKLTVAQEIARLNHADYIIAHNESMLNFLRTNGCKAQLGTLGIFDYLSDNPVPAPVAARKPFRVLYAGALNYRKNRFLYEMGRCVHSYTFTLYGNGFEVDKAQGREHIHYKGFMPSDELIKHAEGDFGLVWDGTSVDTCEGNFGEYLRYNNPHKTSLYLRAGLPVIIWKEAALAPFIASQGVGVCVGSLDEIEEVLARMDEETYLWMRQKACEVGRRLAEGYYVRQALSTAVGCLKK